MDLQIRSISKNFGGIRALNRVSLQISGSQLVGLIGPNGSGKTTLVNTISGIYKPDDG
ncbi:MAG: ATP-binding cassette domain-containing protein, partial [Anaerolineales bacterium]